MKPTVRLWDGVGLGLIIECPSGVVYSNQTGGTSCLRPEMEGVFVPLRNDYEVPSLKLMSPEISFAAYFEGPAHPGTGATGGLSGADADFIDSTLETWHLSSFLSVDRARLRESHEAWVFVRVLGADADQQYSRSITMPSDPFALSVVFGFEPYPRSGVLTWGNSD